MTGDRQDQRRFIRHPVSIPLQCRKEGHEEPSILRMRDMSYGGLAFESTEAFSVGDVVHVNFPDLSHPCSVKGEIVWTARQETAGADRFLMGLRFRDEGDHFHARLIEQICHIENYRRVQERRCGRKLTSAAAAEEWIARQAGRFPP